MDGTFLLAVIFTLLAVLVTAMIFINKRHRKAAASKADSSQPGRGSIHLPQKPLQTDKRRLSENKSNPNHSHEESSNHSREETRPSGFTGDAEMTSDPASWPEREHGISEEDSSEEACADSLKYAPGLLRISQLEEMMTQEEREVERRVQQEQLAAIFQLLKENQETFGDVSEGALEEQLKLYSI